MPCRCAEAYIAGTRALPLGKQAHDCNYIEERNRLIPLATQIAQEEAEALIGKVGAHQANERWSRLFLRAMDREWRRIKG